MSENVNGKRLNLALAMIRKYHARIHSLQAQVNQTANEVRADLEMVESYSEDENYEQQGE